jgi:hypothetical protein
VKDFHAIDRARRPDFPTFICGEIDRDCGHACGLEAEWQAPFDQRGVFHPHVLRPAQASARDADPARGEVHADAGGAARRRPRTCPAIPTTPPTRRCAGSPDALEDVGGLVVGVRVLGEKGLVRRPQRPAIAIGARGAP